jgi:hypothetical protein|tara:strand:+ start:40 stop:558 length:519 start_codon:yes stop_codon:yes gene_type:complete
MSKENGRKNIGRTNAERREDKEERKALFLRAYRDIGTKSGACRVAKVSSRAYRLWIEEDPDFMGKVAEAKVEFGEYLEEIALERVKSPDKNRGSDVLLLGLLNANLPTKFKPQVSMNEDSARDLIIEWRKAARERVSEEKVEDPRELSQGMEKTLIEALKKRGIAPKEKEEG